MFWLPVLGDGAHHVWVSSSGCESGKQLVTWSFQLGIQEMRADVGLALFFSYWVHPANLWVDLPSLVKPLWKQADVCFLGGSQSSQTDSEDRPYLPALLHYLSHQERFPGSACLQKCEMLPGFWPHCKASPVCTLEL